MTHGTQSIQARRQDVVCDATVAWTRDGRLWTVTVTSEAFERTEARADDAFEALCLVRDQLEPLGWRLGVAGALAHVWPSGMSRDQGGGLTAYQMAPEGVGGVVDTFVPVDAAAVVTVAEQRAAIDRLFESIRNAAAKA